MKILRLTTWLIAVAINSSLSHCAEAQLSCPGAEQISIGLGSTPPDFASREPATPPNGNFIIFSSKATNLSSLFVPGASSNTPNVYRYSPGKALELLSVNTDGKAPYGENLIFGCLAPAVTAELSDGSYGLVFHSDATDLVDPPIDAATVPTQVYLRLPKLNRTVLLSKAASPNGGADLPGDGNSERATVGLVSSTSAGSKYRICYQSLAKNLADDLSENGQVIFCKDVTVSGGGIAEGSTQVLKPVNADASVTMRNPALSADARTLVFESDAKMLADKAGNGFFQVYTFSFDSGTFNLISANASGAPAIGNSSVSTISSDGDTILFTYSVPAGTAPGDLKGFSGITTSILVKHSISSGANTQVNVNALGTPSNGVVHSGRMDSRAHYATFSDTGTNLVVGTSRGFYQVYLKSLVSGEIVRVSVTSTNQSANEESGYNSNPAFAPPVAIGHSSSQEDNPFIAFMSVATNLASIGVPDSTNPFVFRSSVVTPTPTATPTSTATATPTPTSTPRTLTNNISIPNPPVVEILDKASNGLYDIQVVCEELNLDPLKIKSYPELVQFLASKKARLTYNLEIKRAGSSKRITRISSRNVVTVRRLTPGRYTIRYRIVATKGNKQIQSRLSPRATITLS